MPLDRFVVALPTGDKTTRHSRLLT
jgi:hypothetical protein